MKYQLLLSNGRCWMVRRKWEREREWVSERDSKRCPHWYLVVHQTKIVQTHIDWRSVKSAEALRVSSRGKFIGTSHRVFIAIHMRTIFEQYLFDGNKSLTPLHHHWTQETREHPNVSNEPNAKRVKKKTSHFFLHPNSWCFFSAFFLAYIELFYADVAATATDFDDVVVSIALARVRL